MYYDRGPQLTVGDLKQYLDFIPDDVKICVGIGCEREPAHYLLKENGNLTIHPDVYMQDAIKTNIETIISFQK